MKRDLEDAVRAELERRFCRHMHRDYGTPRLSLPTVASVEAAQQIIAEGRRVLAKRHHPDVGGTHEGMLGVNVTADYLESALSDLLGVRW